MSESIFRRWANWHRRHPWRTGLGATLLWIAAGVVGAVLLIDERSTLLYTTQFILGGREPSEVDTLDLVEFEPKARYERIQESSGGSAMVSGNRVTLLVDGPATYRSMLEAIESAENHINLETYIIKDDEAGEMFADALKKKAAAGVEVNLLYDTYGSLDSDGEFFDDLEAGGIRVRGFQDIVEARFWRIHQRDHRKLLIVDGRVGFIGGINISAEYLQSSATEPGEEQGLKYGWRDTHAKVEGPVVADLQRVFLDTWLNSGERTRAVVEYFPELRERGEVLTALVSADRFDTESRILDSYLGAIHHARERIWITQAYFVPHYEFVQSLIDAAQRGVDVRVITPSFTDIAMVLYASHAHYTPLLEGGVKLCQLETALLHAKTAVVDSMWSTVGSSNLDIRSLEHNHESNLVIVGQEFAAVMEDMFRRDSEDCRPVDLETWKERGWWQRVKERGSLLLKYWI